MRKSTITWLTFAVIMGAALFFLKYRVIEYERELATLNREILDHQQSIHVLNAEWAFLNRPDHLQKLNEKYTKLRPLDVTQYVAIDQLPNDPQKRKGDE